MSMPIVVRIKTPHDLAITRITARDAARDTKVHNPEKARDIVSRFAAEIIEPTNQECSVEISGEVPFDEQYRVVAKFIDLL